MIDMYHVINNIRKIRSPIVTSLGVKMRNPYNEKGEWIGWTGEEVATHFASVESFKSTIPLKESVESFKSNIPLKDCDRGCGRS